MEIHSHYHESGHGGSTERSESYALKTKGHGENIIVTLRFVQTHRVYPNILNDRHEEQFEIGGLELAQLIRQHGKKVP